MDNYYFTLDGESSLDHGIRLQAPLSFSKPSRKYETVSIPGRNGSLHITEQAFDDVICTARCFVLSEGAESAVGAAADWLMAGGLRRLETPEDPDVFRVCRIVEGYETDVRANTLGVFDVEITCQPERWRKSGEDEITLGNGQALTNSWRESKPLIKATLAGSGQISINGSSISFLSHTGEIWVDCTTQNAYFDTENKNNLISVTNGVFPVLKPGENIIAFSGAVSNVRIIPRWWTL